MAEKATTELTTGASTPRSGDSAVIIPEALDSEALEEVAASAEKGIYVTKEEGGRPPHVEHLSARRAHAPRDAARLLAKEGLKEGGRRLLFPE